VSVAHAKLEHGVTLPPGFGDDTAPADPEGNETVEREPEEPAAFVDPKGDMEVRLEQAARQMMNVPGTRIHVCRLPVDPETGEDAGSFEGATFSKTDEGLAEFKRWGRERWSKAHHWFCPNGIKPEIVLGVTKRADGKTIHKVNESEIDTVYVAPRDIDPTPAPKGIDKAAVAAHYAAEQQRCVAELMADPEYAIVLCSGGGAQGFKIYSEPVTDPAKFEECKARNVANGEKKCQSIDHVFRIVGFPNVPNVTKRNAGREISRPYMLRFDDGSRRIDPAGKVATAIVKSATRSSRSSGNEQVPINKSLVVIGQVADFEKRVSPRGQNIRAWADNLGKLNEILIADGFLDDPYTSNSEMGLAYVSILDAAHYSPEETAGDVLDKANPAGIHFRDQPDPYRAIGRAIYKARLRREEAEALDRESPILDPYNHMERARKFKELNRPNLKHYRGGFADYNAGRYEDLDDDAMSEALYAFHDAARAWRGVGKKAKLEFFKPNRQTVGETRAALAAVCHLNKAIEQPCFLDGRREPSPRDVLSFPNCLVDVRTLKTFEPTPDFFTPYACGFPYNADAPEPAQWFAFLKEIFAGEYCDEQIRSLQEVIGYIISSDNSLEKAFLLYGVTRSGKDTIKNMIRALLSMGSIAGPTLDSLATDFGLSQLIGKALAIIGDARIGAKTNKDLLTENILKIVGRGFFTINRKYGSYWEGALPVKMLILSNMLLKLIDESAAIAGRFVTFRTMVSFLGKEDPDLFERKLLPERDGVLLWALEGLRRVRENGRIYESPISVADRRQLARQSSSSLAFIEERLEIGNFATSTKDDVFAEWQAWCSGNGLYAGSKSHFMESLRAASGGRIGDCRPDGPAGVVRKRKITGARLLPKGQEGNSDDAAKNLV
jgi:uncharacterized protein DUF5906/D5-like protein